MSPRKVKTPEAKNRKVARKVVRKEESLIEAVIAGGLIIVAIYIFYLIAIALT